MWKRPWTGLLILLLGTLFLALAPSWAAETPLVFKKKGVLVKQFTLEEFQKAFPPVDLPIFEKHEDKTRIYRGVALKTVLEKVYGGQWGTDGNYGGVDELLFSCIDGYQPSVPLLKALSHQSYLVYGTGDKTPFQFKAKDSGKIIDYGPFYLVWEDIKDPVIKAEGLELWPYQVATVDLISFKERFGPLVPPGKMSAVATRGFIAYRMFCLQCHRINGSGGNKGIELNYPASVTEYFKTDWLLKFIKEPQSVRTGSAMPPFDKAYPHYEKTITDIVEYLKAISKQKIAPTH